ncbi:MAG: class III extradiol ring-cleavage dioxygenase [Desulfobacteraceae bacterium]
MPRSNSEETAQIVYLSHGGGPLPLLGDASHQAMVDFMGQLPGKLQTPDAILVISAHWEADVATLLGAQNPSMYYDYYGFPDKAYEIVYPAPGNPELAKRIADLLRQENIPVKIDPRRGFDHGLFIPLQLMYPQAAIPALQLSLLDSLDPAGHVALGRALRPLLYENILVVGSGFSFHNMSRFYPNGVQGPDPANDAFQNWLIAACSSPMPQEKREDLLIAWEDAPSARYCHPREEHLLPLHVCFGMARKPAEVVFDDDILGKRAVAFLW